MSEITKVSVQHMGQWLTMRGYVFPDPEHETFYVVHKTPAADGWSISRNPDGTRLISGLDRDIAKEIAAVMSRFSGPRLHDFQAILRRYLGSFAL